MLDIHLIRQDPQAIEKKLKTKDPEVSLENICALDDKVRALKTKVEKLKATRNEASKKIGEYKRAGKDASEILATVAEQADAIHAMDHELSELEQTLTDSLAQLPNIPMDDVIVSPDPKDNCILKTVGAPPTFSFEPKNHLELNESLHLFDFVRGAKVAGTGWPAYRGLGARLEWALLNYMLDIQQKNGFEQWILPVAVRPEILFGSGQLPKFANQQYEIIDKDFDLFMIPTAEVVLNGLHTDEILKEEELPLKYTAYTPCFRREAGAAGANERGLIRTHQFNKVEMFCFCRPEDSQELFEQMVANAEEILEGLGLHYRTALLVTGDMSFAGSRTVDVEVWLPGQDRYYEVSSVSNCTDYQARRSRIRFRRGEGKPELVYTLNGSGLATSRLMVALLENNQNADGSVNLPPVLQERLGGIERLQPDE